MVAKSQRDTKTDNTAKTAKKTATKTSKQAAGSTKRSPSRKATTSKKTATTAKAKTAAATRKATAKPKDDSILATFTPYKLKRGEEYMNDNQKQHFSAILHNWKRELMEEVDRTVHHMQDEAASFPDPADRASQEEEFSLELRTRDRERKLIKKIDATLELLEQDEYGYCESCGIEIGIRRPE